MFAKLNFFIEKVTAKNGLVLGFLFCVGIFFYGNILFGNFIFDDNIFIQNNMQIQSLGNVGDIYHSSTTAGSGLTGDNFYRPNQQFIYAVLYSMFGFTPFFFHLVPVLLHILNAFLIFLLFIRLRISRRSAFFGGLIFLLHPVLTEAVSYISGLSEPLVLSSILLTLLFFLKYIETEENKWLAWGGGVFALGLFSKESQVIALGLAILIFILKWKRQELKSILRPVIFLSTFALLSALYAWARLTFLNFTGVVGLTTETNIYTSHLWVRLATFVHIFPLYIKMMIFPWTLYYEKPYFAISSILNFQSILGLVIIAGGIIVALFSLIKKRGEIFFGLAWFGIAMVPFSGIVPLNAIYLEHWLYVPIVGIIFLLCIWFEKLNSNKIFLTILIIILFFFGVRIIMRNAEWGDPVKFYKNELKYTQNSARIYNDLGMVLADEGNCADAIEDYKKAILLNDTYPQTHHNLGRCYESMQRWQDAVNEYLKALKIQPNFPYSINALNILEQRGIIKIGK